MLFKGVKNKNILKYAKVALKNVSKFNKIIKSLYINVYVCSITSLAIKNSLFIAKLKLKLKYKEYVNIIRTNKALKLVLYSL